MLCPAQHGLVKNRSCLTNLLCSLDEVTRRLDDSKQVELCHLYFRKTFDSLNHCLLLYQVKIIWFPGAGILVGEGVSCQEDILRQDEGRCSAKLEVTGVKNLR